MRILRNQRSGFTLVEMLVAIGIFSTLVAVGVGGFANALHAQRQVASLIAAQSNASLALEQMAREIRTGYLFCNGVNNAVNPKCATNVLGPGTGCTKAVSAAGDIYTCNDILDFYNANSENIDYERQDDILSRSNSGSGGFVPITGDNVRVRYLTFVLFGNQEGDHWNPRITISMGITPSSTDPSLVDNLINLQTTVSAREIDCTQTGMTQC
jgi:prepilin-type N-terminal cleavage/methylation domain-containing protein